MMGEQKPEDLRKIVSKHFEVVGLHYDEESVFLPVVGNTVDSVLETGFDALRKELIPQGYIPMLIRDEGELGIFIARKPSQKYRSPMVNVVMLCITIVTTIIAGSLSWASYEDLDWLSPRSVGLGTLFFSFPLMLILGFHETAHYLAAKRHGVAASLPFFLPAFPPLGTFGAFISMRDPIPNRKALLDIGVSGPIAGFIMTILVTMTGIWLSNYFHIPPAADTSGLIFLGTPALFDFLGVLVGYNSSYLLHPTAFAGWVGFLVTSLNLLPAGQLDGGHVARALLGEKAKYAGYASIIVLVILALFSGYPAWVVFILLIMFLGLYHPPPLNDLSRLDRKRKGLGLLAVIILFIAFIPVPISQVPAEYGVGLRSDETFASVMPNESVNYTLMVENKGNTGADMKLDFKTSDHGWVVNLSKKKVYVPAAGYREVNLTVRAPLDMSMGNLSVVNVTARPDGGGKKVSMNFFTTAGYVRLTADARTMYAVPGPSQNGAPQAQFTVSIGSLHNSTVPPRVNLSVRCSEGWDLWPSGNFTVELPGEGSKPLEITVRPPPGALLGATATISVLAQLEDNSSRNATLELTAVMGQVFSVQALANVSSVELMPGDSRAVLLNVTNTGNGQDEFVRTVTVPPGLVVSLMPELLVLEANGSQDPTLWINASSDASPGLLSVAIQYYSADHPAAMAEVVVQVVVLVKGG